MEIAGTKSSYLVVAAILAAIAVVAQMTPFYTVYLLVRELVGKATDLSAVDAVYVSRLGWYTVAGVSIFGVLTYAASMTSHVAAFNILYEIRKGLAAKLARLPMGYFTSRASGSVKKVLSEDVERIELFVAHHIVDLVQALFLPIVSLVALFFIDWRLAFAALIPLPFACLAQVSMYGKSGMNLYGEWQKRLASMNGTIVEYVRGMGVVKVFNQTVAHFRRLADDVYAYRDLTIKWIKVSSSAFSGFLTLLGSAPLFIVPIAVFLLSGETGEGYRTAVSTVFLFLYIGMGIALPLYKLLRLSSLLVMINTGLAGIDDILAEPEITEPAIPALPNGNRVEFKDVSFAYGESTVLDGVSFEVPEGTITALVGPSGGGKSTIANLLGRFWDVKKGSIRIGGVDIRDMSVESLNDTVATVFQDVFLFFDTIEENIRMGNESASFEQVVAAARAAQIHDFIESLPEGYRTKIGEGGVHLSGGEQQRVALARTILKDSPVIILDEATAYADPENEAHIQEALSVALKGKTVVIIAHRLYTITDVDQILVVDGGRIAERGSHEELLRSGGMYKKLWDAHVEARDWRMDKEVNA
jgi:ATP-binding cassette subfamily B protein